MPPVELSRRDSLSIQGLDLAPTPLFNRYGTGEVDVPEQLRITDSIIERTSRADGTSGGPELERVIDPILRKAKPAGLGTGRSDSRIHGSLAVRAHQIVSWTARQPAFLYTSPWPVQR